MGMESEGLDQSLADQSMQGSGEGLDHHHPHPYEVEVRAFHYMPAQVTICSAPRIRQIRRIIVELTTYPRFGLIGLDPGLGFALIGLIGVWLGLGIYASYTAVCVTAIFSF